MEELRNLRMIDKALYGMAEEVMHKVSTRDAVRTLEPSLPPQASQKNRRPLPQPLESDKIRKLAKLTVKEEMARDKNKDKENGMDVDEEAAPTQEQEQAPQDTEEEEQPNSPKGKGKARNKAKIM